MPTSIIIALHIKFQLREYLIKRYEASVIRFERNHTLEAEKTLQTFLDNIF